MHTHRPNKSCRYPQGHGGVALLRFAPITLKTSKTRPKAPGFEPQTLGEHILYCRILREVTQVEAAHQMGIKYYRTVLSWEKGHTEPPIEALPAILRFLGYDPYPPDQTTLPGRMLAKRRIKGWSMRKAAKIFGVDKRTWWAWEWKVNTPLPSTLVRLEKFLIEG